MSKMQSRRRFLTRMSMAGVVGLLDAPLALGAEGPPETTAVRFMRTPSLCHAPQFLLQDLLRQEGFTDIRYVDGASSAEINEAVVSGKVDFNLHFAPQWASIIDGGGAVTVLAGVHVGCFELFGNEGIRSISDLKGKSVGVEALGSQRPSFPFGHGRPYRPRPGKGNSLGHQPLAEPGRAVCGRQDRRLSRPCRP